MGKIYADDLNSPTAAIAIWGDFCFFAGELNAELISYKPDCCTQDFLIITQQNIASEATIFRFMEETRGMFPVMPQKGPLLENSQLLTSNPKYIKID